MPWCSKDIVSNVHIAVKSCSQSAYAIRDQFEFFILTRVVAFGTPPDRITIESRMLLWRFIIRDATLLEHFEESGFWFDPQSELIYCFHSFLARDDWRTILKLILTKAYRFPDFSETRWIGARDCARAWFAALFTGLDQVVKLTRKFTGHSKEFLAGHDFGEAPETRYFGAIMCAAGLVADAAHIIVLADDRFFAQPR